MKFNSSSNSKTFLLAKGSVCNDITPFSSFFFHLTWWVFSFYLWVFGISFTYSQFTHSTISKAFALVHLLKNKIKIHGSWELDLDLEDPNSNPHSVMKLSRCTWSTHYLSATHTSQNRCEDKRRGRTMCADLAVPPCVSARMLFLCSVAWFLVGTSCLLQLFYQVWAQHCKYLTCMWVRI